MFGDPSGLGDQAGLPAGAGVVLGGGGFALLGGRVVVGGQGHLLESVGGHAPEADLGFSGGAGGLHLGWALVNNGRHLVFPSLGVVGHGGTAVLTTGDRGATFVAQQVGANSRATAETGGWALEVGASTFQLFWGDDHGGMAVGGSLRLWVPVVAPEGQSRNTAPAGVGFLMHFGGGGATVR